MGLAMRKPLVTFQRARSIEWWGQTPDLGTEDGTDGEEIRTSLLAAKQRREVGCEQDQIMAFSK